MRTAYWAGRMRRLASRPERFARMSAFFRHYASTRNLRRSEEEMADGLSFVQSQPAYLILETGTACNLHCPRCWTGEGRFQLDRNLLTRGTFDRIVRHLPAGSLCEASLFNWGEPLLNPDIAHFIRWFSRRGIRTVLHTNFSARDYDGAYLEALVRSGLTHLAASVDGATQASYEKYRVGGNLERVLGNLRRLRETRDRLGWSSPKIAYKMLLNRFNQGEVEAARSLAGELGVEFQLQETMGFPSDEARREWAADTVKEKYGDKPVPLASADAAGRIPTECCQLWNTLVVHANGDVLPCCQVFTRDAHIGNLVETPFRKLWNSEKMRYLRRYVTDPYCPPPDFPNLCARCVFRYCTYNHLPSRVSPEERE